MRDFRDTLNLSKSEEETFYGNRYMTTTNTKHHCDYINKHGLEKYKEMMLRLAAKLNKKENVK